MNETIESITVISASDLDDPDDDVTHVRLDISFVEGLTANVCVTPLVCGQRVPGRTFFRLAEYPELADLHDSFGWDMEAVNCLVTAFAAERKDKRKRLRKKPN